MRKVPEIDRMVVSTDFPEIARVAEQAGIEVPFLRPDEISGDRVSDLPVLQHAVQEMESIHGTVFDVVLMLQPTSPLRHPAYLSQAIHRIVDEKLDSVWSVSPVDLKYNPLKQLTLRNDKMELFDPKGASIIARQDLGETYIRNGVVYAISRKTLLEENSTMGSHCSAIVIRERIANIDSLEDFEIGEYEFRAQGFLKLFTEESGTE